MRIIKRNWTQAMEAVSYLSELGLTFSIIASILFLSSVSESQNLKPLILPEDYFLQSGDRVAVALSGGINFAYETVITPEGKIFIQLLAEKEPSEGIRFEVIDEAVVSGLTIVQAEELLTQLFSKYFKNVRVSLSLLELRTFTVFVGGEVLNPGVYEATPIMRVSQVLDLAQLKGNASKSRIQLLRGDKSIIVNMYEFQIEGDPRANPLLQDEDIIFVPEIGASVVVKGAVYGRGVHTLRVSELTAEQTRVSEGTYELFPGDRVSDILKKAGGPTPWADLRKAYLERIDSQSQKKIRIHLNLRRIHSENDSKADILLRNGDVVVIPTLEEKVYVTGAVNNPGAFDYNSTLSVTDYIGFAGGLTSRANLRRIQILRTDGTRIRTPFGTHSPELKPGDTIVIPETTLKWWQDYVTLITALSSVIISWLVISK